MVFSNTQVFFLILYRSLKLQLYTHVHYFSVELLAWTSFFELRMTSCKSKWSHAYSEVLRWRIVWQKVALGLGHGDAIISQNLNIDQSTVCKVLLWFLRTGTVSKSWYPTNRAYRKLTDPTQLLTLHLAIGRWGTKTTKCVVSEHSYFKHLQKSGFTRQKLRITATQSPFTTLECWFFLMELKLIMRGKPIVSYQILIRRNHLSGIAFMYVKVVWGEPWW